MSCYPRETSPRSFHAVILLPQVAHGRGGLLRCATAPARRPGVIHGVTPPGSVLIQHVSYTIIPSKAATAADLDNALEINTNLLLNRQPAADEIADCVCVCIFPTVFPKRKSAAQSIL
jgi:hypothetical protein